MVKSSQTQVDDAVSAIERFLGRKNQAALTPTVRKITPCPIAQAYAQPKNQIDPETQYLISTSEVERKAL